MHSQPLDLDFNCMSSTPTMDFSKKGSPKSGMVEPIYGNKAACELNENNETLLAALNGSSDLFANGGDRLSGDYDINTVLPPPKTRELAIGESYSDIGKSNFNPTAIVYFKLQKDSFNDSLCLFNRCCRQPRGYD